jgi:hypothetical protein
LPSQARQTLLRWLPPERFEGVRIHTRGPISWLFRRFNRSAVTFGRSIHFVKGYYQPDTPYGLGLIAHEMVHVGQYQSLGFAGFLARYVWHLARARFRYGEHLPLEAPGYALQRQVEEALRQERGV